MTPTLEKMLLSAFGLLTKASARKKVYSQKALQEGRVDVSHLLQAIARSESVQARRVFNNLRGQIDNSDQYVSTIFETEIEKIVESYRTGINEAKNEDNKALSQAFSQLQAAERRIQAFYSKEKKDLKNPTAKKYFVCQFCGYIDVETPPETCPICGANQNAFQEVL